MRQISLTLIEENKFIENQPGYSFRPNIMRPYDQYFMNQNMNKTDVEFNTELFWLGDEDGAGEGYEAPLHPNTTLYYLD